MSGKFRELDVEATLKSTERKSIFLSVPADSSRILRFFPPVGGSKLFALNINHFGLEDDGRGVAYGCLNEHGDGDCPLCVVAKYLLKFKDENKAYYKVGDKIKASNNWYAQVLDGRKVEKKNDKDEVVMDKETGKPVMVMEWAGPYLIRFSKTGADAINKIIRNQKTAGEPYITDAKKGKPVVFTRTGSGFATEYDAMPMSDPVAMDKIFPAWEDKAWGDLYEMLEIKVKTPEQMIAAAMEAHSLDWATVLKEAGLS